MEEKNTSKLYQIGAFARYMGVTPDFLKHYEQFRLVASAPSKSGYRYYPFSQSYKIMDCMSLRGYGLPLKEMDVLLNDNDLPAVREKLDARAEEMQREIRFQQAVLEDHRYLSHWLARMTQRKSDWRVEEREEYCFLPHTQRHDFLSDPRIYEILKSWMNWMPIVKSCLELPCGPDGAFSADQSVQEYSWGLMVPRSLAERYGLPINGAVKQLKRQKWFLYDFAQPYPYGDTLHALFPAQDLQEQLSRLHLTPAGEIYKVILLHVHSSGPQLTHCGYFMVPIE